MFRESRLRTVLSIAGDISALIGFIAAVVIVSTEISLGIWVVIVTAVIWLLAGLWQVISLFIDRSRTAKIKKTFVSYQSQKDSLETLLAEINQDYSRHPYDKAEIQRDIDSAILQLLLLSIAITDKPEHGLNANFMQYDPTNKKLTITNVLGHYPLWRSHREFPIGTEKQGSCGLAFKENRCIVIPDCKKDSKDLYLPFAEERRYLLGVVNIPAKIAGTDLGACLNIDSPIANVLSGNLEKRIIEIQKFEEQILELRKRFLEI